MKNRHKIRVWRHRARDRASLWYVECLCGWEPRPHPVTALFGRPTWDAAFAIGIAHQTDAETARIFRDVKGRFKSPRKSHDVHNCDSRCW